MKVLLLALLSFNSLAADTCRELISPINCRPHFRKKNVPKIMRPSRNSSKTNTKNSTVIFRK